MGMALSIAIQKANYRLFYAQVPQTLNLYSQDCFVRKLIYFGIGFA